MKQCFRATTGIQRATNWASDKQFSGLGGSVFIKRSKVLWGLYRCQLSHGVVKPIESLSFDPNMSILGQTLPVLKLTRNN